MRSTGTEYSSNWKPRSVGDRPRGSWRQLAAIADFRAVCVVNATGFLTVFGARSMLLPLIARDSLHLSNTAVGASAPAVSEHVLHDVRTRPRPSNVPRPRPCVSVRQLRTCLSKTHKQAQHTPLRG